MHRGIRDAGDAACQHLARADADHVGEIFDRSRRNVRGDQPQRRLVELSVGRAIRHTHRSAFRRKRSSRDPTQVQGGGVHAGDVRAGAEEINRMPRRCPVEIGGQRQPLVGENRLVESPADDPAARFDGARCFLHPLDHRIDGSDTAQVQNVGGELPDLPQVDVRVVESGQHGPAMQVDPRRAAGAEIAVLPRCRDQSILNGER